ncbi:hypothetical protein SKAU_G00320740 [Synaphobranchus kaupii]|uniref:Uncharacterized protein n=1 Tax=Synaphobranchus kaupii TaxID=118154 RepID=A0A9Q1ENL6_SYNKA|nr:hypothetical protein SKAU_G00320740 [Synaphobranchus kaupii]
MVNFHLFLYGATALILSEEFSAVQSGQVKERLPGKTTTHKRPALSGRRGLRLRRPRPPPLPPEIRETRTKQKKNPKKEPGFQTAVRSLPSANDVRLASLPASFYFGCLFSRRAEAVLEEQCIVGCGKEGDKKAERDGETGDEDNGFDGQQIE